MIRCDQGYRIRWVPLGSEHGFVIGDLLADVQADDDGHVLIFRPPPLGYLRDALCEGAEGAFTVSRRGKRLEDYWAVVTSIVARPSADPRIPSEVAVELARVR